MGKLSVTEKTEYSVPTCNILGFNVSAIDMTWLLEYTKQHINDLKGKYICVSNVHTTVLAYEDAYYREVQNGAALVLPDGGPLSTVGKMRGYSNIKRTTGPEYMEKIFKISEKYGFRHYFYGSTEETISKIKERLYKEYPDIKIAGMYSPPFRDLTENEDEKIVENIKETEADFVWIGLGAPKQEIFMHKHRDKFSGVMVGVGAAFDYYAGNIKRAPKWMQKCNCEWLYRLLQDPKRLFKRYLITNTKFIWNAFIRGK